MSIFLICLLIGINLKQYFYLYAAINLKLFIFNLFRYVTATEWSTLYGGKRKRSANDPDFKDFRRLPIDHCALSLQPWENPYCDEDGNIFDLVHIVPYLKKFKVMSFYISRAVTYLY